MLSIHFNKYHLISSISSTIGSLRSKQNKRSNKSLKPKSDARSDGREKYLFEAFQYFSVFKNFFQMQQISVNIV